MPRYLTFAAEVFVLASLWALIIYGLPLLCP